MTTVITAEVPTEPYPGTPRPVRDIRDIRDLQFADGHTHYVHADVVDRVTQLTIRELKNAEIYLLAPMLGSAVYLQSYRDDVGVLNFLDCENVTFCGDVTNLREFKSGDLVSESSCALNIARSTVTVRRSFLRSHGKLCLSVHSGSVVRLQGVGLSGYYMELINGGSQVRGDDVEIYQLHPDGDSHSAIWVAHSAKAPDGKVHYNSQTTLNDVDFYMTTGRSIVSGNGAYHALSGVELRNYQIFETEDRAFGFMPINEHYHGVRVNTDVEPEEIIDLVTLSDKTFGRFVNYFSSLTKPPSEGACEVNGVSTEDL
jgi:hypothetical protein